MANSLVSLFEDFKLEDVPQLHVLEIEYPVRGLLPPDTEPLLTPPVKLDSREAPPHDQRRAGVFQSTCRVHIPIQKRENVCDGFQDSFVSQHNAFKSMSCGPGTSRLEAVVFHDDGYEGEVVRLSLHISLKRDSEDHYYTFEILREKWRKMVDEDEDSWVRALDKLMTRRSDRAYYHVRNRIAADYGEEAAVAEEAKWGAGWGGTLLRQQERAATTVGDIDKMLEGIEF
jgi:hypothetical protein